MYGVWSAISFFLASRSLDVSINVIWLASICAVSYAWKAIWLADTCIASRKVEHSSTLAASKAWNATQGNPTEPQFSLAKDDVTPFKVNGDPSTLTDQRIPTRSCERSVRCRCACGRGRSWSVEELHRCAGAPVAFIGAASVTCREALWTTRLTRCPFGEQVHSSSLINTIVWPQFACLCLPYCFGNPRP